MPKKKQPSTAKQASPVTPEQKSPVIESSVSVGEIDTDVQNGHQTQASIDPVGISQTLQKLASALDSPAILDEIMQSQPDTSVEQADLILINPDRADTFYRYILAASWSPGKGAVPAPEGTHLPFATFNAYFETPQPIYSQNTGSDPALDENARQVLAMQGEAVSIGVIPLHAGGQQMGVLVLKSTKPGAFSDGEMLRLPIFASPAALTIERLRLSRQAELAQSEKEVSAAASAALTGAKSYSEILEAIRQYTFLGRNAQHLELCFFDRSWSDDEVPELLEARAVWTAGSGQPKGSRSLLSDIPLAKKTFKSDAPAILDNGYTLAAPAVGKYLQQHQSRQVRLAATGSRWPLVWYDQGCTIRSGSHSGKRYSPGDGSCPSGSNGCR